MESQQLTADDGTTIWLYRWLPAVAIRGVVLVVHGLSEHGQRYARFAHDLNLAGFAVYAYDQRGHGAHAELRGWFAEQEGWQRLQLDLDQVRATVAASHPEQPLYLFGHSMGSYVARQYVLNHGDSLDGLVLSALGYRQGVMASVMRAVTRTWGRVVGERQPSRFLVRLIFGSFNLMFWPRRTPADWLSRDPLEVDRYLADPLCASFPTPALWVDLFGGVRALEQAEKRAPTLPSGLPVLLLAGSRDPVSRGKFGLNQLARRYRAAGVQQIDRLVYPGGRHEMHNEINRSKVMRDLVEWFDRHPQRHPSGR